MNYLKVYNNIIERRKYEIPEGYSEKHHIIPRSLGGNNKKSNLIRLTAREHFICHLLLVKIYEKEIYSWKKMINAVMIMRCDSQGRRYINSRLYTILKKKYSLIASERATGNNNNNFNKIWMHNIDLKSNISVEKENVSEYLLLGWKIGRIIKWDSYINKQIIKENKQKLKEQKYKNNVKLFSDYYKIYNIYGWDKFKQITKFTKTKQFLVMSFKKYVKNFKPQSGKKRGIK